jgi:hypothetical protein
VASATPGFWEKLEILLDPFGKILTGLMVVVIGIYTNGALQQDQQRRAYVELLSKREEADGNLRKDMFSKVIDQFVKPGERTLDDNILNLELLAYNFHESIDLGPLLKHVYAQAWAVESSTNAQRRRLQDLAQEIVERELVSLEGAGCLASEEVAFERVLKEGSQPWALATTCTREELPSRRFRADVYARPQHVVDLSRQTELDVILTVETLPPPPSLSASLGIGEVFAQASHVGQSSREFRFAVSPFDFPLIDNVRLGGGGGRVAIVMRRVREDGVTLALVYFPDSRTSLRDKPFQDEVMKALD